MQSAVNRVAAAQFWYIAMQVVIVPMMLVNWALHASRIRAFEFMMQPLAIALVPLAELALILSTVGILLGMAVHVIVGPRVELWSDLGFMAERVSEHVFVGALRLQMAQWWHHCVTNVCVVQG